MYGIYSKKHQIISMLIIDKDTFNQAVLTSFNNSRGTQSKGSDYTFEDYMKDKVKIKFTMEIIK